MEQYFRLGVVTSPHGIRGALRVFPKTEDPQRFLDLETVYYSRHDSEEIQGQLHITHVAFQQEMVLLSVSEITDRDAAEKFRGVQLWVDREHALELEEGEYYMADLIGAQMIEDNGTPVGKVTDYMETGSNEVLIVDADGKELLIPFIRDVIREVDIEKGEITVHMLPGLRELS